MSDSKPARPKLKPTADTKSADTKPAETEVSAEQRLPDLYALLSLKPLEPDRAVIESALRRLAAQVKSSHLADDSDPAASRSAKLFERGKHHLLSAERKERYDQQWLQVFGGIPSKPANVPATTSKSETTSKYLSVNLSNSELARLLPQGNPNEPFQLGLYLQNRVEPSRASYEVDFEKLQSLLGALNDRNSETDLEEPKGEREGVTEAVNEGRRKEGGEGLSTRSVEPQWGKPISQTRQRRKQREQKILWGAIATLAAVGVTLAGLFWKNPSFTPRSPVNIEVGSPDRNTDTAQNNYVGNSTRNNASGLSASNTTPRRSGLPSVAGVSAEQDLTLNIDALVPVAPAESTAATPAMTLPTAPSNELMIPAGETASTPKMTEPKIPDGEPPPQLNPPQMVPQPELTDADRTAWLKEMTTAKKLIGEQAYQEANELLSANEPLAKTTEQQSHLQRLKTISRLAEELQLELCKAIEGLGAGEVVMIGTSTPVAVVDWDQVQLTVRIRGENRKFALPELPIGLAFALSDISLDAQAPSTQARKAAFALVHPGAAGNDLAAQRAKEMMAAAVAAGVVDQDLMNAFSE